MARSNVVGNATRIEPEPGNRTMIAVCRAVANATHLSVRLPSGDEIELPEALVEILRVSSDELSSGHAVTLLVSEDLLTPAQVGRLLGLSRPFVARLLDQGLIPSEHLPNSTHRVVRLADVLDFQARRERRREGSR